MISDSEIRLIGRFNKPHGINGEISLSVDGDMDIQLDALRCIIVKVDDINVPFFIESVRSKGWDSVLVRLQGVCDEDCASEFSMQPVYALCSDIPEADDEDGFYASDLIGFSIRVDGMDIGYIADIDESTENVLFVVSKADGASLLIPVTDDFIKEINVDEHIIVMCLPSGLLEL